MEYLIALIAALVGGFFWQKGKRDTAESLLTNVETKKEVNTIEAEKQKNNASLQLEEDRRKMIEEKANEEKNSNVADSDLLKFLNDKK